MTFIEIIGYFGALFIGMVMGLTGSGGSILSVPILAYLFKYDEKTATAYSLFIVGVTAILGSIRVIRAKMVNVSLILYFGIPAIFGVLFSRRVLLPLMPDALFEVFGFRSEEHTSELQSRGHLVCRLLLEKKKKKLSKKARNIGRE